MRKRTSGVIRLLMGLIIATACGSGSPSVATTSPTPATVLDDHFGFITGNAVRRESDTKPLFVLNIPNDTAGVVSPDGRRLAYLANNELHVIDIAPNAQPRTLFTITGKEGGGGLAWSSDSTGLVVGVNGPMAGVSDVPPAYTKLRIVDAAGGTARDVISIRNAAVVPLAWDRQAHLIAAYEATQSGAGPYDRTATLAFRVDGKAVVITRQSGIEGSLKTYAVAVDLTSGRSVVIPMTGNGPLAGTSVRIGS